MSKVSPDLRQVIRKATGADRILCWTCSSCDTECPVEITLDEIDGLLGQQTG